MGEDNVATHDPPSEIAFYYPGVIWRSATWIKNLILFFDGVGLLVPAYMRDRPEILDPSIVAALREHNLLRILEPETVVDKAATEKLVTAMTDIIASGALDSLSTAPSRFHELSYSRLGSYGDPGLARMVFEELKARGLARDTEDGVSIPLHPQVRALVLVLLAQILRSAERDAGIELAPVTDQPQLVAALQEVLSTPAFPSAGHVVSLDLQTVGVDLSLQPIDEILAFRKAHLTEYRAYARAVRRFVRELGPLPPTERDRTLAERREEVGEMASRLSHLSRSAWGQLATFTFGIAGATWLFLHNDPLGALLAAGTAAGALAGDTSTITGTYTYLFEARARYG